MKIRIASRESRLAMWQAEHVRQCLLALPEVNAVEIIGMTTQGDQILDKSLSKIGGKGLFIKELEQALLHDQADLAVHSGKDIPMSLASDFELLGFMTREDPRDAWVSNHHNALSDLPEGSVVGSSSLRRQAQILMHYPHLQVQPLRGNLDTRLSKLDAGQFDGIVLAAAGLKRLALPHRIRAFIEPSNMLPAVGQGALGLEISAGKPHLAQVIQMLIDPICTPLVQAEREVSKALGGSCQVPIAAHATLLGPQHFELKALVASPDGRQHVQAHAQGALREWQAVAQLVVRDLFNQGAQTLMHWA